jgi:hypothetical protein
VWSSTTEADTDANLADTTAKILNKVHGGQDFPRLVVLFGTLLLDLTSRLVIRSVARSASSVILSRRACLSRRTLP